MSWNNATILRPAAAIILLLMIAACSGHSHKGNRLSSASSPYLRQHADNPVDWFEWNDEAMAKAKKENKPLLISIGYASCHWCHVMERESFMDTGAARIMNENFVCIKVDREERPDIDNIYMNACQLLTGGGGWPLNAFALPDGKPFFAGTYYNKQSWIGLLRQISEAYRNKNSLVVKQAEALTNGIAEESISFLRPGNEAVVMTKSVYDNLFDSVYKHIDIRNGGLAGTPKFPMPAVNEFLLQYHYLSGDKRALDAANNTLTRMALGGMYDQVGGGFARYSTDSTWRIPHFEKMLYDNGQLVSLYAHAYQLTKNEFYKTVLTETITFVERDLSAPGGAFYCSLNADTDAGEGEFYAWKSDEFNKAAGSENKLAEYFNVTPGGNWEKGRNILYASAPPQDFSILKKQLPGNFNSALSEAKNRLLAERNKRSRPARDSKILTAWNAIMLKGYTDAYTATGNEAYLSKALSNAKFIEKNMMGKDGSLKRQYKEGETSIEGFLDDYAWVARAFIRLYQVCFDKHWLDLARQVTEYASANFYDPHSGMFYYTGAGQSNLPIRKMEIVDNEIPSSNAIVAGVLYELGVYFEDRAYADKCAKMFSSVSKRISTMPAYYAHWCSIAGMFSYGTYEIAVMGEEANKKNQELQRNYLPTCFFMGGSDEENLPLLKDKLQDDKTLIYVCTNKTCKKPAEATAEALRQIRSAVEKEMN